MAPSDPTDWKALELARQARRQAIADAMATGPEARRQLQAANGRIHPLPGATIPVIELDDGWDGR